MNSNTLAHHQTIPKPFNLDYGYKVKVKDLKRNTEYEMIADIDIMDFFIDKMRVKILPSQKLIFYDDSYELELVHVTQNHSQAKHSFVKGSKLKGFIRDCIFFKSPMFKDRLIGIFVWLNVFRFCSTLISLFT